jgi:hypothetical protein
VKLVLARKLRLTSRELTLISLAVLAMSLASVLSLPGPSVWAAYQSPISPLSPTPPPTVGGSPTPVGAFTPVPVPQTAGDGNGPAPLVAGGSVLAGLIVGAVVLLVRGQPPDDPQEKE